MKKLACHLSPDEYDPVLFDYPSRKQTIEEHADQLVRALQTTVERYPDQPIHFVTHSLGGVILRSALNHKDCPHEAKLGRAVLLSPPNQGSAFARYLNRFWLVRRVLGIKTGQQLLTTHSFEHLGQFPKSVKLLVISGSLGWNPTINGANDGKVGVFETKLATPHHRVTLSCGHSWMMYSPSVIKCTVTFITKGTCPNCRQQESGCSLTWDSPSTRKGLW